MDRSGTTTGDKDCGTDEGGGDRDFEKLAKASESIARQRVIGGLFFCVVAVSAMGGFAASKMPWYLAAPICSFGGLILMFFGMGIEWLRCKGEIEGFRDGMIAALAANEARWKKRIRQAVADTKKECGGFAIEAARAVAGRVANRIVARHARNLLIDEHREATLKEVDEVLDTELRAFQDAIQSEEE